MALRGLTAAVAAETGFTALPPLLACYWRSFAGRKCVKEEEAAQEKEEVMEEGESVKKFVVERK